MLRRATLPLLVVSLAAVGIAAARPAVASVGAMKWPPWLSIESPVNPFDAATRDAVLLVHAMVREGTTSVGDLAGSAEGVVGGQRRSIALRFDPTPTANVYAVRRQWPAGTGDAGSWMLRITLLRTTTALVMLDRAGGVASVHVPTQQQGGLRLPRAVSSAEIDSALAVAVSGVASRR